MKRNQQLQSSHCESAGILCLSPNSYQIKWMVLPRFQSSVSMWVIWNIRNSSKFLSDNKSFLASASFQSRLPFFFFPPKISNLSLQLISSAIQRCRMSEDLCRLSVVLKRSPVSDPPILGISSNILALFPTIHLTVYLFIYVFLKLMWFDHIPVTCADRYTHVPAYGSQN